MQLKLVLWYWQYTLNKMNIFTHVHLWWLSSLYPVYHSYSNSLVLVASQELRERALSPVTQSPAIDINDLQYGLIEVVGCSRHFGISRPLMTSKYLKIDARSVYHHTKTLRKLGLIVVRVCVWDITARDTYSAEPSLVSRFSHVLQCMQEKSERPGQSGDVIGRGLRCCCISPPTCPRNG